MASGPIGIFDSGVGGLTVASAIKQLLPRETIVYFGDTAHLPYGDKSPEAILHYSKKITDFLLYHNCKIILAACNTVSATVWDELENYIGGKALHFNVIDPVVARIAELYPDSSFGIIGTKNTINSGAYPKKIKQLIPGASVCSMATPLLVPMIEEGFVYDDISNAIIRAYLSSEKLRGIDTLIPGCTHYPIIRNQIRKFYDFRVEVVDSAMIVANHLQKILQSEKFSGGQFSNEDRFFVSDHTEYFGKIARIFFDREIVLEKTDLWK
ncbi:MAG: glutamate racemase [Bacteroidales bacterium]